MSEIGENALLSGDEEENGSYDLDNALEDRLLNEDDEEELDEDILELTDDTLDEDEQNNRIDRFTSERNNSINQEENVSYSNDSHNSQNMGHNKNMQGNNGNKFRGGQPWRRGSMRGRGSFNNRGRGGQFFNNNNNNRNHYSQNNSQNHPKKCFVNPHFQQVNVWEQPKPNNWKKPILTVTPWQTNTINHQTMPQTSNLMQNNNYNQMNTNRPLLNHVNQQQPNYGGNSLLGNFVAPQHVPQHNFGFQQHNMPQQQQYPTMVPIAPTISPQFQPQPIMQQQYPNMGPPQVQCPQNYYQQSFPNTGPNMGQFVPPPQQQQQQQHQQQNYPQRPSQYQPPQFEPPNNMVQHQHQHYQKPRVTVFNNNSNNMQEWQQSPEVHQNRQISVQQQKPWQKRNNVPQQHQHQQQHQQHQPQQQQHQQHQQQKRPWGVNGNNVVRTIHNVRNPVHQNTNTHRIVVDNAEGTHNKQRKTYESASNTNLQVVITTDVKTDKLQLDEEDDDEETRAYRAKIEEQKRQRARILAKKEENRKLLVQQKLAVKEGLLKTDKIVVTKPLLVTPLTTTIAKKINLVANPNLRQIDVPAGFLNARKVISKDESLAETMVVSVKNLASCTGETQLRKLCSGIGHVKKFEMSSKERQATIEFNSVASAHAFYKKYQRFLLDLSMIQVELKL